MTGRSRSDATMPVRMSAVTLFAAPAIACLSPRAHAQDTLAFSPIVTANWDAESGQQWTIPLGLGISKVTSIGQRPMSLSIQYYSNVEHPDAATKSLLRFAVSLLFPVARAR